MKASRKNLTQRLRSVEAGREAARRSNLRWYGITAAVAGLDPLVAFVPFGIKTWKEIKNEADWSQWKKEAEKRLRNKPRIAAELARQTRNNELKGFFEKIAQESRYRATVRRRLGIQGKRTGPMTEREMRLRVLRRLRGG